MTTDPTPPTTTAPDLGRRAARLAARLSVLPAHRRAHAAALLARLEQLVDDVVANDVRPLPDDRGDG